MKLKNQKGISLTVLVITIIVMLILASSTVNVLLGSEGLFHSSWRMKREQESYANQEDAKTNELINELDDIRNGAK